MAQAKKHRRWIVHSHEATKPIAKGAMADINITPFIDVLLVLLIIFMVVTPLAQKGLDIALPQAQTQQQQQQQQSSNQVVMALEESFDIAVPDEDVERLQTIGDVQQYLELRSSN